MARSTDYDFFCANDSKSLRFAININDFHSARISTEYIKNIDLSGGTKSLKSVHLFHCLKVTRIIWPTNAGHIEHLLINSADDLRRLDLSCLPNLKELSILNCEKLNEISGLGENIEIINIHNTEISTLDLRECNQLKILNIDSNISELNIAIENLKNIHSLFIKADIINSTIESCVKLNDIYIHANTFKFTVIKTPNITNLLINGDEKSELNGLKECKKIQCLKLLNQPLKNKYRKYLPDDNHLKEAERIDSERVMFRKNIEFPEPGQDDMETVIEKKGTLRERNQATFIRVSLFSESDSDLKHIADNEYTSFAKKIDSEARLPKTLHFAYLPWIREINYKKVFDELPKSKRPNKSLLAKFLAGHNKHFRTTKGNNTPNTLNQKQYKHNKRQLYTLLDEREYAISSKYFNYYLLDQINIIRESLSGIDAMPVTDHLELLAYLILVSDYFLYHLEKFGYSKLKKEFDTRRSFLHDPLYSRASRVNKVHQQLLAKYVEPGKPLNAPPKLGPARPEDHRFLNIGFNIPIYNEIDPSFINDISKKNVKGKPIDQPPSLHPVEPFSTNLDNQSESHDINLALYLPDDEVNQHKQAVKGSSIQQPPVLIHAEELNSALHNANIDTKLDQEAAKQTIEGDLVQQKPKLIHAEELSSAISDINIQYDIDLGLEGQPPVLAAKQKIEGLPIRQEIKLIATDPSAINLYKINEQYSIHLELPEEADSTLMEKQVFNPQAILQSPLLINQSDSLSSLEMLDINYHIQLELGSNTELDGVQLESSLFKYTSPARIKLDSDMATSNKDSALMNGLLQGAQDLTACLKLLNSTLENDILYKPKSKL